MMLYKYKVRADDFILYCNTHSIEDCHTLQRDLDLLTQWSHKWKMIFNPEFLRITNKKNITSIIYYIDNHSIKEVTHAKYLGIIFNTL